MSSLLGWAGWPLAVGVLLLLRRRLALVADAEHELRGSAAALGFAAERMRRAGATRAFASLVALQLDRMSAGLADLERSRRSPLSWWRHFASAPRGRAAPAVDSGRLAQVVANLVANATEHGRGPVQVSWSASAAGARLEIRNRNRPPELADLADARRAAGRGRGVEIARRAAHELGGSLRFDAGGDETVATLSLPAPASEASAAGAMPVGAAAFESPAAGGVAVDPNGGPGEGAEGELDGETSPRAA